MPPQASDYTGQVITALGLVLGVLLAYLQVQKNQRASLELQETHLRNDLKLKLYEKVCIVLDDASKKLSKVDAEYRSVLSSLSLRVRNGLPVNPRQTGSELSDLADDAHRQLTRVLNVLEEYEIAFLRFATFRKYFASSHSSMLKAHSALWSKALPYLPFIHATTKAVTPSPFTPTLEDVAAVEKLLKAYSEIGSDVSGYLIDLQIETQNELLGALFDRTLPPRHPADPNVTVLRRDAGEIAERPKGSLI